MSLNASKRTSPITGVILAGGESRRMGKNKALLQLAGNSLVGHVIRRMHIVTDELLLITNSPSEYAHLSLPTYEDIFPNTGALGGIYTGLSYASHDAVLCVACDSPFLEPKLLTYLVSYLGGYEAVMPYTFCKDARQTILQPLCAAYSKRCLHLIELMFQESELRAHAFQERARVKRVPPDIWQRFDPDGTSFFNINTPEDFDRAQAYIQAQTQQ